MLTSRTFARFLSDAGRRVERLLGAGDDGIRDMMRVGGIDRTIDFGVDHANDDGHDDDDEDGDCLDADIGERGSGADMAKIFKLGLDLKTAER